MTHELDSHLLSFEELPLRLRLEGFQEETAHAIAHQWLCSIRTAEADTDAYRIRLTTEPHLRFQPPSPERLPRRVPLRTRTVGDSTELRTPGARTSFTAGQSFAELEIHPHLIRHPGLMEIAVGGPLGHALALAGASFLHGAAILVQDLPILILGGAQAGKSTVAAAALAAGGAVVSDDSLILYPTASGGLAVRSLRRNLLLRESSLRVLPGALHPRLRRVGPLIEPRWELERETAVWAFQPSLEPAVLCVLRQDRRLRSSQLTPLNQARAFAFLLDAHSSPHLLHPAFRHEQHELIQLWSRLVAEAPAFELRLGRAVLDSPARVLGEVASRLRDLSAQCPRP